MNHLPLLSLRVCGSIHHLKHNNALSLWVTDHRASALPLTNLVKDVEVPLVNRLAGHPGLL